MKAIDIFEPTEGESRNTRISLFVQKVKGRWTIGYSFVNELDRALSEWRAFYKKLKPKTFESHQAARAVCMRFKKQYEENNSIT
jgi:hypothetical protein